MTLTRSERLGALGPDGISGRIRAVLPSLSPAAARVAALILKEPDRVAGSTLVEVSKIAGTSEATVLRTARELGFSGYPDLRLALAAAAGARGGEPIVTGDITAEDSLAAVVTKLTEAEMKALRETAAHLDLGALSAAVTAVVAARRRLIYGVGASGLVAADLHHKLVRIGLTSSAPSDAHLAITEAVLLGTDDVVIIVSDSGYTTDSIDVLRSARTAGARTVAVTSDQRSPLALESDHILIGAGTDSAYRPAALSSRISHLLVVDCLFIGIAQRTQPATARALERTREALSDRRSRPRRTG